MGTPKLARWGKNWNSKSNKIFGLKVMTLQQHYGFSVITIRHWVFQLWSCCLDLPPWLFVFIPGTRSVGKQIVSFQNVHPFTHSIFFPVYKSNITSPQSNPQIRPSRIYLIWVRLLAATVMIHPRLRSWQGFDYPSGIRINRRSYAGEP